MVGRRPGRRRRDARSSRVTPGGSRPTGSTSCGHGEVDVDLGRAGAPAPAAVGGSRQVDDDPVRAGARDDDVGRGEGASRARPAGRHAHRRARPAGRPWQGAVDDGQGRATPRARRSWSRERATCRRRRRRGRSSEAERPEQRARRGPARPRRATRDTESMSVSVWARLPTRRACWKRVLRDGPACAGALGLGSAVAHLAEDLRLADGHRVQAAGDGEGVGDGPVLVVDVEVVAQLVARDPGHLGEGVGEVGDGRRGR